MKHISTFLIIFISILVLACFEKNELPNIEDLITEEEFIFQEHPNFTNSIQLDSPAVGQRNRYIKWTCENGLAEAPVLEYEYEDTLVVKVVAEVSMDTFNNSYDINILKAIKAHRIEEYWTSNPSKKSVYTLFSYGEPKIYVHSIFNLKDSLVKIPELLVCPYCLDYEAEQIFSTTLELPIMTIDTPLFELQGLLPYSQSSGYLWDETIKEYEQEGQMYRYPNIRRDNREHEIDGDLMVYWYFKEVGIIRLSKAGFWSHPRFRGLDIIVE